MALIFPRRFAATSTQYLFKSLKRTSPPKLSTITPNPSKLGVQLVHGTDTDPAEVLFGLGGAGLGELGTHNCRCPDSG